MGAPYLRVGSGDDDGHLDLSVGAPGENGDDGAVTFLRGSGTKFTTSGAKGFSAGSLGSSRRSDGCFGDSLGFPSRQPASGAPF